MLDVVNVFSEPSKVAVIPGELLSGVVLLLLHENKVTDAVRIISNREENVFFIFVV